MIRSTLLTLWHDIVSDLAVGFRRLLRSPLFAVISIASIGLSTAALTAVFSILSATDFRELPFGPGDRVSIVYTSHDARSSSPGSNGPGVSYDAFAQYRVRSQSFERLEGVSTMIKRVSTKDGTSTETIAGHAATPGFLPMLAVRPQLGRWFADQDTLPGAERVVVFSHAYWSAAYGGDTTIVGKLIALSDQFPANAPAQPYRVIGVLPRNFVWSENSVFWVPMAASEPRSVAALSPVGVLRANVSVDVANREARAIGNDLRSALEAMRPPGDRSLGGALELRTMPLRLFLHERIGGRSSRIALFGLALCVFVLAVANVMFLTLLAAQTRRSEFAVRRALGASLRRITRQTVAEAAVLALPASAVGSVVAPPLIRVASDKLNVAALGVAPSLDASALAFTILISLLITVALGLAPAVVYASRDLAGGIFGRTRATAWARLAAPHRLLVVLESALALVVLTGAGLVVKDLGQLQYRELGYVPAGATLVSSPIGPPRPAAQVIVRGSDVLARIRAVPGVTQAAIMSTDLSVHLRSDATPSRLAPTTPRSIFGITPDYFALLRIPILRGRGFLASDDAAHSSVTILSAEAAHRLFPGVDPIGRKVALAGMGPTDVDAWTTVVGVAGDAHVRDDPTAPRQAVVYRPFSQAAPFGIQVLAKTARGETTTLALRDVAAQVADAPTDRWTVRSLDDAVSKYLSTARFSALSLTTLGIVGLSLALVGIFGITAFRVSTQARDIAIRVALGAESSTIVGNIVRESARLVLSGLLIGVAASAALSRLMHALLHETSALDPAVYVAASLILAGTAVVACLIPARRVLAIDPARALRLD